MVVYTCKMCGGTLQLQPGQNVAECAYCGSRQTVPTGDNEKKMTLFARANRLRRACQFDKAAGIYETIAAEFPEEAESFWGLVLCKYGIEYVDDPVTGKKIPTCHRTLPGTVLEDKDYRMALSKADVVSGDVYRSEAARIEEIQRKIHKVVAQEAPYDVFLCYKETDDITLQRTQDSEDAQDIYTELTKDGYRVFYSRISLRSRAGSEYEPYIYAALSSAKVMLVLGSRYEYFDAVWVKNEWGRYLEMMKQQPDKVLIPCCRNIDSYDMPRELRNLPVLDMGDMMFYPALKAKVERAVPSREKKILAAREQAGPVIRLDSLIKRAEMFLEQGDWEKTEEYAGNILDMDSGYYQAYLIRLMARFQVKKQQDLAKVAVDMEQDPDYLCYLEGVDSQEQARMREYAAQAKRTQMYQQAMALSKDDTLDALSAAMNILESLGDWADASEMWKKLDDRRKDLIYYDGLRGSESQQVERWLPACELFARIPGWKDADSLREQTLGKYKDYVYQEAMKLKNREEPLLYADKPGGKEHRACVDRKIREYDQAVEKFRSILPWKDAQNQIAECEKLKSQWIYQEGVRQLREGEPETLVRAAKMFVRVRQWKDSEQKLETCRRTAQDYYTKRLNEVERGIRKVREGFVTLLILCAATAFGGVIAFNWEGMTEMAGMSSKTFFPTLGTVLMCLPAICAMLYEEKENRFAGIHVPLLRLRHGILWAVLALAGSVLAWGFWNIFASYLTFLYGTFGFILKLIFAWALFNLIKCGYVQLKSNKSVDRLHQHKVEEQRRMAQTERLLAETIGEARAKKEM